MPRCRVVQPSAVTLQLTDGDWIQVKRVLNNGEYRESQRALLGRIGPDGSRTLVDEDTLGMAEVLVYLVAWSLLDSDGTVLPLTLESLKAIDPDSFREIRVAVEEHKARVEEEIAAAKKQTAGSTGSDLT